MPLNHHRKTLKILLLATIAILAISEQAEAYIGPGAGFTVGASLLAMFLAILSAVLALVSWPIRYCIRAIRYRHAFARSRVKRFVILGNACDVHWGLQINLHDCIRLENPVFDRIGAGNGSGIGIHLDVKMVIRDIPPGAFRCNTPSQDIST